MKTFTRSWFADFLAEPLFAKSITTAVVPTNWHLATTVDIIYPNLANSFDSVNHRFLSVKSKSLEGTSIRYSKVRATAERQYRPFWHWNRPSAPDVAVPFVDILKRGW